MSNTLKWIIAIVVVILVLAGIWYWQADNAFAPTETGPIKIGWIGPLTGEAAPYGLPSLELIQMAINDVNGAGGINGREVILIAEDGKCDGKEAVTAAQKLINVDKVQVIIGGFCSSESLAIIPIVEDAGVLLISSGSSSPDLSGISDFFVRTYPSDATQGETLANVAFERGWMKVAFIQEQQDYSLGIYNAFAAKFDELGGEVLREEYAPNDIDFKTQLAKLKSTNPDALFIASQTSASAELIIKQLQELDWTAPLLFADTTIGDRDLVKRNAAFLEGTLGAEFEVDTLNSIYQDMVALYEETYGKELLYPQYGQTAFDAIMMVLKGQAEVGNDGKKLVEWIKDDDQVGMQGASGSIVIGDNGDRVGGHILKVVRNGEVVPSDADNVPGE